MDEKKLLKIEKLARLDVKLEDRDHILELLNNDISTVKSIESINTDGLDNLINPYEITLETYKDEVNDGNKQEELMNCSQKSMYGYFTVPKILNN